MHRRTLRAVGLMTTVLAVTATAVATPPAEAAPQNVCSGEFCATFDLVTYDALAPTQTTTAAGQPTNLALRFTDTSGPLATEKATWLAKVWAVLGASSTNAYAVTDPATLPLGAYVAGSSATASTCAPGMDGSGYATSCPAGHGDGLVELIPLLPGPAEIKPATFGIQSVTVGPAGAMTASVSIYVPGVTILPLSTTAPVTYAGGTASAGPSLSMDVRFAAAPVGLYASGDFSMNTVALNLNGLVTEASVGAVSPSVPFVRQPLLCTSMTSTLRANARGPQSVSAPFTQTTTSCPPPPTVASVVPDAAQPRAFTFTTLQPTALVPGRTVSLEWVFGDGTKALTGTTTSHTYPVAQPVVAFVSSIDSAGARSPAVAVPIAASRLRGKQREGHLITGLLADQETGEGVPAQEVLGYRCATRATPISECRPTRTATTKGDGSYRLRIPEVTKKGFVLVVHRGSGSTSVDDPARFASRRYIEVLPQPEVTLKVSKKQVHPGAAVRLSGRVEPGKKGKTVRLQGFLRGKWRSVGKATISQQGTYAASYVVRAPGQDKVKLRAFLPGTARTLEATSHVRRVKILR